MWEGTVKQGGAVQTQHELTDREAARDWFSRKQIAAQSIGYRVVDTAAADDRYATTLAQTVKVGRKERTTFVHILVKDLG